MAAPLGTSARTGESCPVTGVWQVVGTPSASALVAEGDPMPTYRERPVVWELSMYA